MDIVDLRSDTITQPTPAMRAAMANAVVGDDVYGEDPTVNRLEELAAEKMSKEAGLFVPSGTMGNLAAILTHCNRGDEAIMGNLGHTFLYEGGGLAALGGVQPHLRPNQPDGTLRLEDIRAAIRPNDLHQPISRLLVLENTHNRCGAVALSVDYCRQATELARSMGLKTHLDGARIFNAAIALGTNAAELAQPFDSVTFCLSKGLCAPVGSVLCGSADFIARARRIRKQLGGGMRQAGILAAAGIVALEEMPAYLAQDHRRAKALAVGLAQIKGLVVESNPPHTNMVFVALAEGDRRNAAQVSAELDAVGVKVGVVAERRFRLVTHYWIDDAGVERVIQAFGRVCA